MKQVTEEQLRDWRITQGKKLNEIADILGCSIRNVYSLLQKYHIGQTPRIKIGDEFGFLTVINACSGKDKHGHTTCECVCERCGRKIELVGYSLWQNKNMSRSCGCEHPFINKHTWRRICRNKMYDSNSDITIDTVGDIFTGKCAISGMDIHLGTGQQQLVTATLDKIHHSLHWTINNVQWIHINIKDMMSHCELHDQDFIEVCCAVALKQRGVAPCQRN